MKRLMTAALALSIAATAALAVRPVQLLVRVNE